MFSISSLVLSKLNISTLDCISYSFSCASESVLYASVVFPTDVAKSSYFSLFNPLVSCIKEWVYSKASFNSSALIFALSKYIDPLLSSINKSPYISFKVFFKLSKALFSAASNPDINPVLS